MQKKFDPKVFQLGYVALGTPDIQRTKDHYLQNLGMTEVARGGDGSVYLSIGYNHHDLVLRPATQKALLHVGFHLKPHIAVGDFARDARELGLDRDRQDRQSARRRRTRRGRGAGRRRHPVLQRDCSSRSRLQANRRIAAAPRPRGDHLNRRRQADRVLPGLSRLRSHRRHSGDRELPHLQSRPPRRQYREGAGIAGPPYRLRAQGELPATASPPTRCAPPASTFSGARRGTPRATTWPPTTTTPTR